MYICPTCKSEGFEVSKLPFRCSFCDGSEGGNPPSEQEIIQAKRAFEKNIFFIKNYGMRG